ncbi:hypothetical protein O3M35_000715 [Rhynocoris fuscipes]|uniref:Uncharacterized protein n=1 Tax=Rhynocoris fuscipes TaxID=488301 RepID=A0AAW1DSG2_9HEMI
MGQEPMLKNMEDWLAMEKQREDLYRGDGFKCHLPKEPDIPGSREEGRNGYDAGGESPPYYMVAAVESEPMLKNMEDWLAMEKQREDLYRGDGFKCHLPKEPDIPGPREDGRNGYCMGGCPCGGSCDQTATSASSVSSAWWSDKRNTSFYALSHKKGPACYEPLTKREEMSCEPPVS